MMWHPKTPRLGETYGLQDVPCMKAYRADTIHPLPAGTSGLARQTGKQVSRTQVSNTVIVISHILWNCLPRSSCQQYPTGSKCRTAQQWAHWRGCGQSQSNPSMSQTFIQCGSDSNWYKEKKRRKGRLRTNREGPCGASGNISGNVKFNYNYLFIIRV